MPETTYRSSTFTLVQRLKGLPEWAKLNEAEATRAIMVGLAKLTAAGEDPWELLPVNELNQLDAQEDFRSTWRGVKLGLNPNSDPVEAAFEEAKRRPVDWSKELEEKVGPVSARMKLFMDMVMYLQGMSGDGYILLPQVQLGKLFDVSQQAISEWCRSTESVGILKRVDGRWSQAEKKAIRWHSVCKVCVGKKA